MNVLKTVLLLPGIALLFSACKKDKKEEVRNDNETITTMIVKFRPAGSGGGADLQYQYDDPDGPGGAAATKDVITLAPNKLYIVDILLLDKTKTPVDTVSKEVAAEANAHRFYYTPSAGSDVSVILASEDHNGDPLGITSLWTTYNPNPSGKMLITLRHYAHNGKGPGDTVNSDKSSTDIEVEFDTRVQ